MSQDQIDTWRINSRIGLYVLAAVSPLALTDRGATKGRSAGEIFAHIHNVRLMWLQSAAVDLHKTQVKIEKEQAHDAKLLASALTASANAIATMLPQAFALGKIKGFKPHPSAFVGYLISHEGYHLGEIGIVLQQAGHPLDKKTMFGIWEWGVR